MDVIGYIGKEIERYQARPSQSWMRVKKRKRTGKKTSVVSLGGKQTSNALDRVDHLPCSAMTDSLNFEILCQRMYLVEATWSFCFVNVTKIEEWGIREKILKYIRHIGCPNINLFLSYISTATIYDHKTYRRKIAIDQPTVKTCCAPNRPGTVGHFSVRRTKKLDTRPSIQPSRFHVAKIPQTDKIPRSQTRRPKI